MLARDECRAAIVNFISQRPVFTEIVYNDKHSLCFAKNLDPNSEDDHMTDYDEEEDDYMTKLDEKAMRMLTEWMIESKPQYVHRTLAIAVCVRCGNVWFTSSSNPRKHFSCGEQLRIVDPEVWIPLHKMIT